MNKRIFAFLFLLLIIPYTSWSYTYQDVQNFVDSNPAPDGCFNWTEEYTTPDGETGIYVWRRCGGGLNVVGDPKFQDYAIVYGSGPHPPAHWYYMKYSCATGQLVIVGDSVYDYNGETRFYRGCDGNLYSSGVSWYDQGSRATGAIWLDTAECRVDFVIDYDYRESYCRNFDSLLAGFIPIEACSDSDGDGFYAYDAASCPEGTDCNDSNAVIHPATTWFRDLDGDGFTDGVTTTQCVSPAGYKLTSELISPSMDCDDNDPFVNLETTWYRDGDGDGYADGITLAQCGRPVGYKLETELSSTVTDCDDSDPLVNVETSWYQDMDDDGYSEGTTIIQCELAAGFRRMSELSSTSGDCNDNNSAVNPGAEELCGDGEDNNCDGRGDEVFDQDNDGYLTCEGDCNDLLASVNPGATETCYDDIDNNCYEGADETCYECSLNKEIGSSANIGSGNLFHSQDILTTSLTLTYNSKDRTRGPLGRGWTHTYNTYIKQSPAGSLLLTEGDGRRVYFFDDGGGIYQPDPRTGEHS